MWNLVSHILSRWYKIKTLVVTETSFNEPLSINGLFRHSILSSVTLYCCYVPYCSLRIYYNFSHVRTGWCSGNILDLYSGSCSVKKEKISGRSSRSSAPRRTYWWKTASREVTFTWNATYTLATLTEILPVFISPSSIYWYSIWIIPRSLPPKSFPTYHSSSIRRYILTPHCFRLSHQRYTHMGHAVA